MTAPLRRGLAKSIRSYPLVRPARLSIETLTRRTGLHPDLIHRYVALGLLDVARDSAGDVWFTQDAPATIARIQRLRAGLSLNYASIGLVLDLLDRITQLELALRSSGSTNPSAVRSDRQWT